MAKLDKWHYLKTRVSWVIVALLLLPMAVFALWQPNQGASAGEIFGARIPIEDFQQAYQQARLQYDRQLEQLPEQFREQFSASEEQLTSMAWDRLLLREAAKRQRVAVTDAELLDTVKADPAFQTNGAFDRVLYQRVLRANGVTPELFERQQRQQLAVKKLADQVLSGVAISDEELNAVYRSQQERLRATVFYLEASRFNAQAEAGVTEAAVKAYYDAHQDEFRIPEQIALQTAGASREELGKNVAPDDAAVKAYYDGHPEEFKNEDGGARAFDEAKEDVRRAVVRRETDKTLNELAVDIGEAVRAKKTFDEIAAARQLTPKSYGPMAADNPWGAGLPEPAVMQQAKTLPAGQMSGLIETDNGAWIARVTAREPSRVPPLEDARARIMATLKEHGAKTAARQAADAWRTRVREKRAAGWRYEEIFLEDTGGIVPAPSTFTRAGDIVPIGHDANINGNAFATRLGELTEVLEARGGYVALRPEEKLPSDDSGFEAKKTELREAELKKKKSERFEAWMSEQRIKAKIKSFAGRA